MHETYLQDGYKIKVNKLQACDNSGTMKIINPKIELTQDCIVAADGCVQITKGFSNCKVCFKLRKVFTASQQLRNKTGGFKNYGLITLEFCIISVFKIRDFRLPPRF
jgi:hypothetical protein